MKRAFLAATACCALIACTRSPDPRASAVEESAAGAFEFTEMEIGSLQERMSDGRLSSRRLTQAYLDRIAVLDDAGPRLNAVIEINPDALREADARDAERSEGHVRGPLHGVPILIKDNIDATPMVNSAGSLALADHNPKADAFLVRKLRASGAVILGKTNLSEWANFRSTRSSSGWSGRGGLTRNPYALDRSTCGSSSGTAAAVSASMAAAGVGTETVGSIICPSSVTGLVGIKPTVGLISRSGIIPISHSFDTAGPMARSVADAAMLLAAMAGPDEHDGATQPGAERAPLDYQARLKTNALQGARIGVLRKAMGLHPDVDAAFERAIDIMQAAGATMVDTEIATAGQWSSAATEVLLYEFKADLNEYLAASGAPLKSLDELIQFNSRNAAAEMPYFGQELFEQAQAKGSLDEQSYQEALAQVRRLAGAEGVLLALQSQHLDALIAPARTPAWLTDVILSDRSSGTSSYAAAALAGTPSITVPMGESFGLPFGIVFMGSAWSEPRLIGLAYAFEQATKARRAPTFRRTVNPEAVSPQASGSGTLANSVRPAKGRRCTRSQ